MTKDEWLRLYDIAGRVETKIGIDGVRGQLVLAFAEKAKSGSFTVEDKSDGYLFVSMNREANRIRKTQVNHPGLDSVGPVEDESETDISDQTVEIFAHIGDDLTEREQEIVMVMLAECETGGTSRLQARTAERLGVSRQAVHKLVKKIRVGRTRDGHKKKSV